MGSWGRNFVLQDGGANKFYYELAFPVGNVEVWKLFNDIRAIPLAVAAVSLFLLLLHALYRGVYYCINRKAEEEDGEDGLGETRLEGLSTRLNAHSRIFGGYAIYGFMLARPLGSMALFYLSMVTLRQCEKIEVGECPEAYFTISYVYAAMLAFVSVISKTWSTPTIAANLLTLLSALGVYAYRDLWPLAKYDGEPSDTTEGSVLWIKIALLAFTTVFIPLFVPRRYIPVDLKNPTISPNPEQTSSIFSMMTYTFLDPVIAMGCKVPHLPTDQLPPLNDRDGAKHLRGWAFKHLNMFSGAKRRSMFLRLMRVFRLEYSVLALTIFGYSLGSFASPIGMYQILFFLETRGAAAVVRPWFWIIWLIVGPMVQSFSIQWYSFIATRTFVRTEALLIQLVFEHSLRIRLKAEATDAKPTPEADAILLRTESDPSIVVSDTASVSTFGGVSEVASGSGSAQSSEVSTAIPSREPSKAGSDTTLRVSTDRKLKEAKENQRKNSRKPDGNLIGKINNLVTTDLNNITAGGDFLLIILYVPLQITLCLTFLYRVLGWSAFVGFAVMLVLLPIPGYVAAKLRRAQKEKMKKTDARVQSVTEAVNVIRMVKLFGWEAKMTGSLREKREDELKLLWKTKLLDTGNGLLGYIFPTITMMATYSFYTVVMKQELTASKIFSSMTVFANLREQLQRLLGQTGTVMQAKVSLDRIDDFLHKTELLDAFMDTSTNPSELFVPALGSNSAIGFKNATFSWSLEEDGAATTPSSGMFKLRVDEQLLFTRNCINLIVGPTGSGKTSMLMALLGEMHFIPTSPDSWFNLPREGGVAYAAQESWVQSETIKNNILFGSAYDEKRYHKVIKQCALERDLELFESGDSTEVGERGLTLSGGQKARITLARAIYSSAEIILLDDVLAALDVHTSVWIVEKCLQGDLVSGRTIILVTHNVALVSPIADVIVSIGSNGRVRSQGTALSAAITRDPTLAAEAKHAEVTRIRQEEIPAEPKKLSEAKLIVAEEIVEGHITCRSLKLLLDSLCGGHPIFFFVTCVLALLLNKWSITFQTWFLGCWGSQYETRPASEVDSSYYLALYTTICLASFFMYAATYLFYIYGTMNASRIINNKLMDSVFGSTLRWLDETPTGRIITRCTQDIRAIDGPVPQMFVSLLDFACGIATKLGAIVLFTPLFLVPGVGVAIFGLHFGNMYLKAQLSVKRETSNARSPMLAHVSAAIHGIVSIRAYGAQSAFKDESLRRIDHYSRVARMSHNLNRWFGIRMDALGAAFTAALAAYLIYGPTAGAGNTGFSLNMAVEFGLHIRLFIRIFNDFEVQANSLERIQHYIDIEHEPTPTEGGKPPAAWPTTGRLYVEKLSARYSATGPKVLHDISFQVHSGERIGVVGRTGSGKSSLTLALLRAIFTEGTVYFDGIPTNTINLDALRSSITIIPQIPELLSGSLRQNLDPFDQYGDTTLNGALRAAGLFSLQEDAGEANLTLDSSIAGGGGNLSVGQRQIIALARAMVRGSKLLILDEATSAIDYKTDAIIQSTLRSQLGDDVSVITIAHRLQTIMDADKIMVLDNGRIAEFDSPKELLQNEQGMLRALVDGSGNRRALFELAGSKS